MVLVNLDVSIDQEEVKEYIYKKLDESIKQTLFTIDINKMAEITCMSKSFLENEILHDPRMLVHERRKEKGKRFWFYEPCLETIKQIMDEW